MTFNEIKQQAFFDELEKQATVAGRLESFAKGMGRTLGTDAYKARVAGVGRTADAMASRDLDASSRAGTYTQDYRANMNRAMDREARIDPFRKSVGMPAVAPAVRPSTGATVYA